MIITVDELWQTLNKVTTPFLGYKETLEILSATFPPGYALCFAYHYVGAELINGGISQLYRKSTWSLILTAIKACQEAKAVEEEKILKEIVLYYHQQGRSRLKKQLTENFFSDIQQPMEKSLSQLEDEYYALNQYIVPSLLNDESLW